MTNLFNWSYYYHITIAWYGLGKPRRTRIRYIKTKIKYARIELTSASH